MADSAPIAPFSNIEIGAALPAVMTNFPTVGIDCCRNAALFFQP
jgi:hypothetical protein